jgi:hypothetical protein
MALKAPYKQPGGHVDAYWRISDLRYNYEKPHGNEIDEGGNVIAPYELEETLVFSVEVLNLDTMEIYHDQDWKYDAGVGSYSMPVPSGDATTLTAQAYEHLKTLERFQDAEDC